MLKTMTAYKRWANQELFECLLGLPAGIEPDKRHMMIRLLNHVYVVDRIFQAHLLGKPHGFKALNTTDTPSLENLWQAVQAVDDWYVAYASQLENQQQSERLGFSFVDGTSGLMSRGEMLLHVVNHGSYHRGAVGELLYQIGINAPKDVLTLFLQQAGD